jgi:hypothetical protein
MGRIPRTELAPAVETRALVHLDTVLATAVGLERGGAIGADDAKVRQAVVVGNAVDVIKDQRHRAAAPQLALPTQLALPCLESRVIKALLQVAAVLRGVDDEDLVEWRGRAERRVCGRPVRLEMVSGDAVVLDPPAIERKLPPAARRPSRRSASAVLRAPATASRSCASGYRGIPPLPEH